MGSEMCIRDSYSVATISGKAVRSVNELKVNDKISLRLSDGSVDCTVTNK